MRGTDHFACPFELKFSGDPAAGVFDGYGSVFSNIDSHGDLIMPGAFRETLAYWKNRGGLPPMYMQHGSALGGDARPVGVWTAMDEDGRGLKANGRLVGLNTDAGQFNLALVKEGAMRGLSIGYSVPKGGAAYSDKGAARRTLKSIHLHEVSIVDDPSNVLARIESVRSAVADDIKDPRAFEAFLREAGFPRAFAKTILAHGFKAAIGGLRHVDDDADLVRQIRASTAQLQSSFNGQRR